MQKREDGYNISETGNWNVANDYSKLKIMKNLYLSDEYADVAYFGQSSLVEELIQLDIPTDVLRLKGFDRLINCLIKVIDNSIFAIKTKTDRKKLRKHREKLMEINSIKSTLYKVSRNQKTKKQSIRIEEEKYSKVLEIVFKIKRLINYPLNRSDLIFTSKEEFDPKKYKDDVMERASTKG